MSWQSLADLHVKDAENTLRAAQRYLRIKRNVADHYRHNGATGPNVCDVRCRHFESRTWTHPISLGVLLERPVA